MGLARGAVALLIEEAVRQKFSGRVATLGVQTVYMTEGQLGRQFQRFALPPALPLDAGAKGQANDKLLFKALGFDEMERFDYSDFEGAEHVVDLNNDGLPEKYRNSYDVVVDSGTLEHVFHVPNALKNIISLAKVGGRVIFLSPSSNHMDHGFYMFSPTFFADYFSANGFEINTCYVVRYSPIPTDLWEVYEYDDKWRATPNGGLDSRPYLVFLVATKTPESTSGLIPQQTFYADTSQFYSGARLAESAENKAGSPVRADAKRPSVPDAVKPNFRQFIGRTLIGFPIAYRLAKRIAYFVDKRHLNKKLVGRY